MVLLISALATIGVMKPMFLDSGSPRGEGGGVLNINSSKKTLFSLSLTAICAELCFQTT